MDKEALNYTDLDYLVADHNLQMIKAALPYVPVSEQRIFSVFIKSQELFETMKLFSDRPEGELGICSIDQEQISPISMLAAMKPYATKEEQSLMDRIALFLQNMRNGQGFFSATGESKGPAALFETLKPLLPPEQQSRLDQFQMMFQIMQAM